MPGGIMARRPRSGVPGQEDIRRTQVRVARRKRSAAYFTPLFELLRIRNRTPDPGPCATGPRTPDPGLRTPDDAVLHSSDSLTAVPRDREEVSRESILR